MNQHPTPLEVLRREHRRLLDRQAELSTQARALAQQVNDVTNELADLERQSQLYRAVLTILDTAMRKAQPPAEPTPPRRRATK